MATNVSVYLGWGWGLDSNQDRICNFVEVIRADIYCVFLRGNSLYRPI